MWMSFDDNSKLLATGAGNGSINIYNLNYGELETWFEAINEKEEGLIDLRTLTVKHPVTWLKWRPKLGGTRNQSTILTA